MRYDVYDIDAKQWALYEVGTGYISPWLAKKAYEKWWYIQYGVIGRSLPGKFTIYRAQADEMEVRRIERLNEERPGGRAEASAGGLPELSGAADRAG